MVISVWSRITRSTELRVQRVTYDETALAVLEQAARSLEPMRIIANKRQAGDEDEYRNKLNDIRTRNHMRFPAAVFLEVDISDASDFETAVTVTGVSVDDHRILRATGPSVPNVLAAILLDVRDRMPHTPHAYFEWSQKGPGENALRFLIAGEGDIPPLTHEILRLAEPDDDRRPQIHVG